MSYIIKMMGVRGDVLYWANGDGPDRFTDDILDAKAYQTREEAELVIRNEPRLDEVRTEIEPLSML